MRKNRLLMTFITMLLVCTFVLSEPVVSSAATVKVKVTVTWKLTAKKKKVSAPSKPTHAKASAASSTSNKITWNTTSNTRTYSAGGGYEISFATSKNGKYKKLKNVSRDSLSYTHKGLKPGKTYYYKIRGYNKDGSKNKYSGYSKVVSAKTAVGKPAGVKATKVNTSSIKLNWKKNANETGYKIYRAASANGSYKLVKTISKNSTTSYTDKNLKIGQTYYYKIKTYKKYSGKTYLSPYSSRVSKKLTVDTPGSFKVTKKSPGTMNISWKKPNDITGYKLYRSESKNGTYKLVKDMKAATTSYTDTKLATGKTYYYKLRAYKTKSGKDYYSSYTSVLSKKSGLTEDKYEPDVRDIFSYKNDEMTIKMYQVSGVTGYEIYYATSRNGTYSRAFRTTKLEEVHKGLERNTTYYYKFRTYKIENGIYYYSPFSSVYDETTRDMGSRLPAEEWIARGTVWAEDLGLTINDELSTSNSTNTALYVCTADSGLTEAQFEKQMKATLADIVNKPGWYNTDMVKIHVGPPDSFGNLNIYVL